MEPLLAISSFLEKAMILAPRTRPIISGRIYWTIAALCSFKAPAVSLIKHAIQKPMFAGFPNFTNNTAITPMMAPVIMMNNLLLFIIPIPFTLI